MDYKDKLCVVLSSVPTNGGGGDTTIPSPEMARKQPLPGIGLHDPLHNRQACPEFNLFHQGVGQISLPEGLFLCRPLPKPGQICGIALEPPAAQSFTAVATWERADENLFSILFFTTERSANNVVKKHMGKTREDGVGNGQAAWNALEEKYNSHTKEARRAYTEKLHSTKMKSGDDPDNFLYTMDGFRKRLEDVGQPAPDERYEDIILQAIPAEYERVHTASYERRDFHLADIRRMMSALYIDCLSRPNKSPLVASRGDAIQATEGDDSAIKCHYCGNPVHRQKNCVA